MSHYKHVLLSTDLSDSSKPAAERARQIVDIAGAKLSLLNVVDYVPPRWVANELPDEYASATSLVERARGRLSEWAKQVDLAGYEQNVSVGSPKRIIVDRAREIGADLIVMSTHGDHGVARLLGSTARGVLHDAPCDVLIVHLN